MRSILVHAERGPAGKARIETALSLARMTGGHVTLLIDTPVMRYTTMDAMGGAVVASEALQEAMSSDDAFARSSSEHLSKEDVPFTVLRAEIEPIDALARAARLADIVITARRDPTTGDLPLSLRCPVLAVNDGKMLSFPLSRVCLAWDGSAEAATALRSAIPLLAGCEDVTIITIEDAPGDWPAIDAAAYLSRHGIQAEVQSLARIGSVEETLARELQLRQCQLLVMGAFGHSRMREFLFGGVTRSFLDFESAPPLMLAN